MLDLGFGKFVFTVSGKSGAEEKFLETQWHDQAAWLCGKNSYSFALKPVFNGVKSILIRDRETNKVVRKTKEAVVLEGELQC